MSPHEMLGYVQSLPGVTTAVIGCRTPAEVDENARIVRGWTNFDAETMRRLEAQTAGLSEAAGYYKKPA